MPNAFDEWAPKFDGWRGPAKESEVLALDELLPPGDDLLDVGGGTGRYALALAQRGHRVTILDRSIGMMKEAEKKGVVRTVLGNASHLPFQDRAFPAVLFVEMLHLVDDWVGAVHEMGRVSAGAVVALLRERAPDQRKIYLETRAELGFPTGRLDEGVRALYRMLPPESVREVWQTRTMVDLEERMRGLESQAPGAAPPGVLESAVAKARRELGSTVVEQAEAVKVARWPGSALRAFEPP